MTETAREVYVNEEAAVAKLQNNKIYCTNKLIEIPKDRAVGIKLWGAIDYLQKNYKYFRLRLLR